MAVFLLDLADYQGGLDLASVEAQGYVGVIVKVTEGTGYVNPDYAPMRAQAEKLGLLFAAYHALHKGDAEAQADYFCAHIGDKSIPGMLDFEPFGDNPTRADAIAFVKRCAANGVTVSLDYLPNWYWLRFAPSMRKLKRLPRLVSSNYPNRVHDYASKVYAFVGGDKGPGWRRYGGRRPTLWQFTDNVLIDGWNGGVDCDAFAGTRDELSALGVFKDYAPKPPTPAPKPKPKPKPEPAPTPLVDAATAELQKAATHHKRGPLARRIRAALAALKGGTK